MMNSGSVGRGRRRALLSAALTTAIAGCSLLGKKPPPAPPPPMQPPPAPSIIQLPAPPPQIVQAPPVQVAISLEAGPRVNPDAAGRASPIVVRVYELKSPVGFQAADYFTLFEREQQALGADLIGRDEYQLRPGERVLFARPLRPGTKVVAVSAAFRDVERSTWKAELPVPTASPQGISILIDGRQIRIVAN